MFGKATDAGDVTATQDVDGAEIGSSNEDEQSGCGGGGRRGSAKAGFENVLFDEVDIGFTSLLP